MHTLRVLKFYDEGKKKLFDREKQLKGEREGGRERGGGGLDRVCVCV